METEGLRQRIIQLETNEKFLNDTIKRLQDELNNAHVENVKRAGKDNQLNSLQVRITELENTIQILRGEIDKLNNIIRMKDQDLDALKRESNRKSVVDAEKQ